MGYSEKVARQLKNYLDKQRVRYEFHEDEGYFKVLYTLERSKLGHYSAFYDVREMGVVIDAFPSITVPMDDISVMHKLLEFMCRINNAKTLGSFSLSFETGEIVYHCMLLCDDGVLNLASFNWYCLMVDLMMESYTDGFLSIIYGNTDPEKVFQDIERKSN